MEKLLFCIEGEEHLLLSSPWSLSFRMTLSFVTYVTERRFQGEWRSGSVKSARGSAREGRRRGKRAP